MTLPMHFARSDPDRIAVIDDHDETLTFGVLDSRAWQLARLIRDSGVGEGDHIAICLENRLEYFQSIPASRHQSLDNVPAI